MRQSRGGYGVPAERRRRRRWRARMNETGQRFEREEKEERD
jgi:hypothetical protein